MKNMISRAFLLAVLTMGVVMEVHAARGIVTTKPSGGTTSGKVASPPDSTIPGGATYMDNPMSSKRMSVSEAKPMAPREEASSSQSPGDAAATEQDGSATGEDVSLNNVSCPKGCYVAVKDGVAGCVCEGKWTRGGSAGSAMMKGGSSHESRDMDSDNAPATSKAKDNQGKGTIRNDDLK